MSETELVKDNKRGGEPERLGDDIYSISHIYSLIYGHSLKCYTDFQFLFYIQIHFIFSCGSLLLTENPG